MFLNINYFFSFVLLLSALVLICIGYFSWKRDKLYVSISLIPVSIYAFGYAFEILCTSIEWVKFWIKVEYFGAAFLGVLWLMFALNFTGYKEKIKKRTLMLLYIIPVITLVVNYTNDFHHLFYKKMYMNNEGIFPIVEVIHGPWYWVNIGIYLCINGYRSNNFYNSLFKSSINYKKTDITFNNSLGNSMDFRYYLYVGINTTLMWIYAPLAFSFSAIMYSFAILKFKFLKLTPIALEKVFSNMLDGVIILDSENNIVNFNNSSKNIISELKDIEAGDKKIDEVLEGI